jgi:hypothetical protein
VHGEHVGRALADGAVEDLLAGVVAHPRPGLLAERAERQVLLPRREHRAVHEVGPFRAADLGDRGGQVGGLHLAVLEPDVRRNRLQLDLQPQRVAEGAVGVGEAGEQVGVLAVGRGRDDLAVGGENVHLEHRLVRQPVPERGGLDAEPGHRSAERDRLQLRDHERHEPVRQRGVDQVLVGGHALHVSRACHVVDGDHAGERGRVESAHRFGAAEAEQVRGPLGQPHPRARRQRPVPRDEIGDRRVVPGGRQGHVGDASPHPARHPTL